MAVSRQGWVAREQRQVACWVAGLAGLWQEAQTVSRSPSFPIGSALAVRGWKSDKSA